MPNSDYGIISKIISKYPKFNGLRVICDSSYDSRREYVSETLKGKYKYILINSTVKNGVICMYSSKNDLGHYGIPKVIFCFSGINTPVLDIKGEYGMTSAAIGIPILDKTDGILLINYLMSDEFKVILKACLYSSFLIDWRIFAYFKDGFWRSYKKSSKELKDTSLSCMQRKTIKN